MRNSVEYLYQATLWIFCARVNISNIHKSPTCLTKRGKMWSRTHIFRNCASLKLLASTSMDPGPSVDPKVVENIVDRLKKRGLFDKFRKECLIDIDTTVSDVVIVVIGSFKRSFRLSLLAINLGNQRLFLFVVPDCAELLLSHWKFTIRNLQLQSPSRSSCWSQPAFCLGQWNF